MLANYAKWYSFTPPHWHNFPPPLTSCTECQPPRLISTPNSGRGAEGERLAGTTRRVYRRLARAYATIPTATTTAATARMITHVRPATIS